MTNRQYFTIIASINGCCSALMFALAHNLWTFIPASIFALSADINYFAAGSDD